ncbi:MAG: matrixin family metalloprotease [Candidatus Staskawiczbacteria bacterium]|nr:matrixin family metalloprotease [Candidatus Staskawiczbacteria bacterium]
MLIPANDNAKEHSKAPENSPVITDNAGNWDLERVDFIHYARPAKPPKGPSSDACYKLMGVKWSDMPVSYAINPANSQGLSEGFIVSAISDGAETWDASTSSELFNNPSSDYSAQYGVQDFKNSVAFGNYSDSNVIAVTSVWFTRRGKQIVEFDQLYNTQLNWGDASVNPALMDLQNIATHELGHAVGLDDIYSTSCDTVTMYGYSTEGETSKRTLEQPDINGLQKMYGI